MKQILILTADAGFGHRSAANAVAAVLRETYLASNVNRQVKRVAYFV
jgi:FMN-dependent NADH-azoreductase